MGKALALGWGVPFPRPTSDGQRQTTYVWFDALPNYWTATRLPGAGATWPAQLHVVGKDITRFHAVYWPAFLMSAGIALPKRVYAHGFLFNRGEKMSKSVGNVVDPMTMATRYGVDQLRLGQPVQTMHEVSALMSSGSVFSCSSRVSITPLASCSADSSAGSSGTPLDAAFSGG